MNQNINTSQIDNISNLGKLAHALNEENARLRNIIRNYEVDQS